MEKKYNFLFDTEPSESELQELMQSVLDDVTQKSKIADAHLASLQQQQVKEALKRKQNAK